MNHANTAPLSLDQMPAPPRVPFLGHAPWLIGSGGPVAWLNGLAEEFRDEGLFRVTMPAGPKPVFIASVALASELLDEQRFHKVLSGPLLKIREFAGDGLFTADGDAPNWHKAHGVLVPAFTTSSMERYFPTMRSTLQELIEKWRRADAPVDVVADMTRLALETISRCGFDHDFHSFDHDELDPFLQALGRCMKESTESLRRPKQLGFLFRDKQRAFERDIAQMFTLVDDVIAARKRMPRADWPSDFLSLMLERPDPKSGALLDDENVRFQILTFLIAGHETTSGLLAFTLHRLASDPVLFSRVRAEVDAAFGDSCQGAASRLPMGGRAAHGEPTRDGVWHLDLTMRVLSEALRLWPTVPSFSVAPIVDEVIGGHWRIPAGQPLSILVNGLHRDPSVWREPARFDPDRFLASASEGRPAAAYKPFGNGKRSCIGRQFALLEATMAIALIVRELDVDVPAPLRIGPSTSPKPKDFALRVRPRSRSGARSLSHAASTSTSTAARCPFHFGARA